MENPAKATSNDVLSPKEAKKLAHKMKREALLKELEEEDARYKKEGAEQKERAKIQKKKEKGETEPIPSFPSAILEASHLYKVYSSRVEAVSDFSLAINKGEFIVLVGPSGCGKSTTLRMISGLEDITSGDLFIEGKYANKEDPKERGVAMVFQSYALYPHMSVYENMAFGLGGLPKEEVKKRIMSAAEILQITEYLKRKPTALSGGQCQRVALGRALVRNAKLFLLDEPLSNLDAKLRVEMRSELIKLHDSLKNTMIYVTHDQTEAMTMATRIVVLNKGVIQQIGTPREIYDEPSNVFVASFMGSPSMNLLDGAIDDKTITFKDGEKFVISNEEKELLLKGAAKLLEASKKEIANTEAKIKEASAEEKRMFDYPARLAKHKDEAASLSSLLSKGPHPIIFGVRPEDIVYKTVGQGIKITVELSELLGAEFSLHAHLSGKEFLARVPNESMIHNGDVGYISFPKNAVHLFDPLTGKRLF